MAETKAISTTTKTPAADGEASPVVVDLGSKSRKKIKQLRRGEGSLLADLDKLMAELKTDGTLTGPAQAVVVVVKSKRRRPGGLFGRR